MQPVMNVEELETFLETEFPQIHVDGRIYRVESVSAGEAVLSVCALERHLRPGGTISGPTMMALVDLAAYAVILAHIGPVALAVTTNLNINFLRKPEPGDLLATWQASEAWKAAGRHRVHHHRTQRRRPGRPCDRDLFDPAALVPFRGHTISIRKDVGLPEKLAISSPAPVPFASASK